MARKRAPELKQIGQADTEMEMILYLAESEAPDVHLFFRRSEETGEAGPKDNEAYITFYSPRVGGIPPKLGPNHFRFPLTKISLYHRMVSLLKVVEYELSGRHVVVHFGWPLSSWMDRLAIGVMVFNLMRLPRLFPRFRIRHALPQTAGPAADPPGSLTYEIFSGLFEADLDSISE